MLLRIPPKWVFLLVTLTSLGMLFGSQRRVVVHSAADRDLRLTAHRLGVPVDRVEKGRQALRMASGLVGEVTGEPSVSVLAKLWSSLDRKHAIGEIRGMIEVLRKKAEGASGNETYRPATAAAGSLRAALVRLDVDAAKAALENWPAAPEGKEEQDMVSYWEQRRREYRSFEELAGKDVDAAIELLSDLEAGLMNPMMRTQLMHELANRGRFEEANGLLDGMLNDISDLDPGTAAGGLEWVIDYVKLRSPDRLPEVLQAWVKAVREVPDEQNRFAGKYLPDSLQLSPVEARVAIRLSEWDWAPPEQLGAVLSQFPGLQQKLLTFAGLRGLRVAIKEQQQRVDASRQRRRSLALQKRVETRSTAERELSSLWSQLAGYYEDGPKYDPEAGVRLFGRLARVIEGLEDPRTRIRKFHSLAQGYMTYEGELSEELLAQGWDLLERSEEQLQTESDTKKQEALVSQLDFLEVWLLATWAWSDFQAAIKHIETLPAEVQFAALLKVAGWFSAGRRLSYSQTFR